MLNILRVRIGSLLPGRSFRTLISRRMGVVVASTATAAVVALEGWSEDEKEVHGGVLVELIR